MPGPRLDVISSEGPARDRSTRRLQPQQDATRLLKLCGEMFGGGAVGLDAAVLSRVAGEIADAVRDGVQVAIVVGGGNFFRGAELQRSGMDRARADYMGMLGTVMNAIALQDFIEHAGVPARVQSAITMTQVAEPYIPLRAIRHLQKGRVVYLWCWRGYALLLHGYGVRPAWAGVAL